MDTKLPSGDQERETQQDPSGIWSVREKLTSSIKEKLSSLPPSHSSRCIYRVPERLRRVNEEAFTPRLVSIGPLHRYDYRLQAMEDYKLRCLKSFFARNENTFAVIDFIVREEAAIRQHYEDEIRLTSEDFCEMTLLDGIFIVELLMKNEILAQQWMESDLLHDMILIENQLPLFVPQTIYTKFVTGSDKPFGTLVHEFFSKVGNAPSVAMVQFPFWPSEKPRHLTEYLIMAHCPGNETEPSNTGAKSGHPHSARELLEAGVLFRKGEATCLTEIKFEAGVLTIPHLKVNEWTEALFRNLVAFEQCERSSARYVTDYIILMDNLIDAPKDVDVLVDHGIVENSLKDTEAVSWLFNNLYMETITEGRRFYFGKLSADLNDYSKDYWHQWKAAWYNWRQILKKDYFSSPWSIISLIAAVVLLVLTVVQTVCSIRTL